MQQAEHGATNFKIVARPTQSRNFVRRRRRPDRPVEPERLVETAKTSEAYSRLNEQLSSTLPQPKISSHKPTIPKNDPLWIEADAIDGKVGLTCGKATQEFKADAAGYTSLVEEEYRAVAGVDRNFAKSVPLSA